MLTREADTLQNVHPCFIVTVVGVIGFTSTQESGTEKLLPVKLESDWCLHISVRGQRHLPASNTVKTCKAISKSDCCGETHSCFQRVIGDLGSIQRTVAAEKLPPPPP